MPDNNEWPDTPIGSLTVPASTALETGGAASLAEAVKEMIVNDRKVELRDEVDSSRWQESVANSRFAVARTRADLNALLHYGHFIPVSRGLTAKYVDEHFPGWTWNGLTAVLNAAGVFIGGGAGTPYCDPAVGAVHFDNTESWLVEWEDGNVTNSSRAPGRDGQK